MQVVEVLEGHLDLMLCMLVIAHVDNAVELAVIADILPQVELHLLDLKCDLADFSALYGCFPLDLSYFVLETGGFIGQLF